MKLWTILLLVTTAIGAPTHVEWVKGGSMVPAIPSFGHAVLVESIPFESLKKGMVVVYIHPKSGRIDHRLFKRVSPTEWWAKGDANPLPDDAYVTKENYVGVVVAQDVTIMPKPLNPIKI